MLAHGTTTWEGKSGYGLESRHRARVASRGPRRRRRAAACRARPKRRATGVLERLPSPRRRAHPKGAAHARRSSATTTRGRTTSTARSAPLHAPTASPASTKTTGRCFPRASTPGEPFLFVNPDPEAVPLAEHLGELPEILARDLDLDGLVFHSRVEFGSNANWKIVVENFLECYHCATAHPSFSAEVDVHPDRYKLEAHPTFSAQFCAAKKTGEHGQFHLIYPNTGLNVFPGPPNLSIGPIAPAGTGRTERYLDYFFAPDVDDEWLREFFTFDGQVGKEDAVLVDVRPPRNGVGHARAGPTAAQLGAAARRIPGLGGRPARSRIT